MTREISLDHLDRQLERLLSKVDTLLHRLVVKNDPPPSSKSSEQPQQQKLATIDYFIKDMLGYKSRVSYYNHINEPGWPQRVYLAGRKPMLVYDECLAYQRRLMAERDPPPPDKKPELPDGKQRHVGRPAKVPPCS
ncbi:hypothetical protein D3227_34365 [Mesorhizobium waimense]|uniref:Uncharacterized protein n=1 Tax=Mesorhizobium waimense TaxID=1300307 RepID=A0A3A5JZE1_9HYPH|nr:hypothetical protein [Mesorhizobium waimense]RJT28403.1 hypothetical protein D3227_34365 [Mesorhizobium waimense]